MQVLLEHDEVELGVADRNEEVVEGQGLRLKVFREAGYYRPGVESDADEYDASSHHFLVRDRRTGELVGYSRYISGVEELPLFRAFRVDLPAEVLAVPRERRVEGGKLVATRRGGAGLVSLGLLCAASEFCEGLYDVSLHFAVAHWVSRVREAGLCFHELGGLELTYPRDGLQAPYFHETPGGVRAYYGFFRDNRELLRAHAARLGLRRAG